MQEEEVMTRRIEQTTMAIDENGEYDAVVALETTYRDNEQQSLPPRVHSEGREEEMEHELKDIIQRALSGTNDNNRQRTCFYALINLMVICATAGLVTVIVLVLLNKNNNNNKENKQPNLFAANSSTNEFSFQNFTFLGGDQTNNAQFLAQPFAVCRNGPIIISSGTECFVDSIDPHLLDGGSYDPRGQQQSMMLQYSVIPSGPYPVGIQDLALLVENELRQSTACAVQVIITEDATPWRSDPRSSHHAFRIRTCRMSWTKALETAETTTHCGLRAHLATITSTAEHDLMDQIQRSRVAWIGGFLKPIQGLDESNNATGWQWINDEGPFLDGVVEWQFDEPHRPVKKGLCALRTNDIRRPNRHIPIADRNCRDTYPFFEEIDITSTVVIQGCDSGVVERFLDPNSCTMLIGPALDACESLPTTTTIMLHDANSTNETTTTISRAACVDQVLSDLVTQGSISLQEKLSIQFCGVNKNNTRPVAKCVETVTLSAGPFCLGQAFARNSSLFDAGSFDPDDGDQISLSLYSEGPYSLGVNRVKLLVHDNWGASDSCESTLIVTDADGSISSGWWRFQGNAYRCRLCSVTWSTARTLASTSGTCGRKGQLVTIESLSENEFVANLCGRNNWIGAFQARGSEPGEWTWLNDDTTANGDGTTTATELIPFDAARFTENSNPGKGLQCLAVASRGRWRSEGCQTRKSFIEKVDLSDPVIVDGCDTGVLDILAEDSCVGPIHQGLQNCNNNAREEMFGCMEVFLSELVENNVISVSDKLSILYCGKDNIPPVAVCKDSVELQTESVCGWATLFPSMLDDGSFDKDGDPILYDTIPSVGPLPVGIHPIQLVASDYNGRQNTCNSTVTVLGNGLNSDWTIFDNHAYRVNECAVDFESATRLAKRSRLCGFGCRLASVESPHEMEFLINLVANGTEAYSDVLVDINSSNIEDNSTAVDFLSNASSSCSVIVGGIAMDYIDCGEKRVYIEEIDLTDQTNVTFRGCDTGIRDILNIEQCGSGGMITERLVACIGLQDKEEIKNCVATSLSGLVDDYTMIEQAIVANCLQDRPPVAKCKREFRVSASPGCFGRASIGALDIDDGSFDPHGNELVLQLEPKDSFLDIGTHQVKMTVWNQRGMTDSCTSTVLVNADKSVLSDWVTLGSHAYRFGLCQEGWHAANAAAESTIQCGRFGHLATITSDEEMLFIRQLGVGDVWLGAFQPKGSVEPVGGWTWVNGEGVIRSEVSVAWIPIGPDNKGGNEDCMLLLPWRRNFRWNDRNCNAKYGYLMEVDLERTVVIEGCDSGVQDVLLDVDSCRYLIADRLTACLEADRLVRGSSSCAGVLETLVEDGVLNEADAGRIASCLQ